MENLKEHVDLIREVFLYLSRFKGGTFIFKIDYPVIEDVTFPVIAQDLAQLQRLGINVMVVAGARERIDEVLERYGISREMHDGERISSPEAIPFIKMGAFDAAIQVMTQLSGHEVTAVIGNWVKARALGVLDGVDYLYTGDVEKVRTELVAPIAQQGHIPIFPCIGWNTAGEPYNVSSDRLAVTLSGALNADKLFFITSEHTADSSVPTKLTISEAEVIGQSGDDRLSALIAYAGNACAKGVKRVHIVDGSNEGSILREIFSNLGSGIMVHANEHERIRSMERDDIPDVLRIMQPYVDDKILVYRDEEYMIKHFPDFCVYDVDGSIHACGALKSHTDTSGEVAGIAVDSRFKELGIGRRIVEFLLGLAVERQLQEVFLLTTQASDWFSQLGFEQVGVDDLPPGRRAEYDVNRNSRVLRCSLHGR